MQLPKAPLYEITALSSIHHFQRIFNFSPILVTKHQIINLLRFFDVPHLIVLKLVINRVLLYSKKMAFTQGVQCSIYCTRYT